MVRKQEAGETGNLKLVSENENLVSMDGRTEIKINGDTCSYVDGWN